MKTKIEELIKRYEEYRQEQIELSRKADGYGKGLHEGYADAFELVIEHLKSILEGDEKRPL